MVMEDDVVMRETDDEDDGGAKAVAPAANVARVRAAESFMLILKWLQYVWCQDVILWNITSMKDFHFLHLSDLLWWKICNLLYYSYVE